MPKNPFERFVPISEFAEQIHMSVRTIRRNIVREDFPENGWLRHPGGRIDVDPQCYHDFLKGVTQKFRMAARIRRSA